MRYRMVWMLLALLMVGCSGKPGKDGGAKGGKGIKIKLALNWYPEAEHGGFIAAHTLGYFEEEGLDVEIVPGGPGAPVIQNVATGRVEFAVANADQVLLGREEEADVVALMTAMQTSPRCIMVHKKSGIESFDQLKNLTLAVGSGKPFFKFLQTKAALEGVKLVNYTGSIARFVQDDNFAQQGYVFSEPFVAEQQKSDPHCLMVSKTGFDPYTSLLITNEKQLKDNREVVAKVVRACRKGWAAYLKDPAKTNQAIHEMRKDMSIAALEYGANALRPLCLPDGMPPEKLGTMTPERWKTLFQQLVEVKLLAADSKALDGAFSMEFLE